jgi:hypothetical protein
MEIYVDALNRSMSAASQGRVIPYQGHNSSVHASQGHRSLIALPNFSMLKIPNPPNSFDLQTELQLTKECGRDPEAAPDFIQRKLHFIISILLMIHVGSMKTARW